MRREARLRAASGSGAPVSRAHQGAARDAGDRLRLPGGKRLLARHGGAVLLVAACTAAAIPLHHRFELTNLTMIYLLGVVIVALAFGRGPAILASVLSVATFDWVFVPPRYTFEVEDAQFLVTFVVMLVVALVIGSLTARVREELAFSRARERRTSALYGLSRELASRSDAAEILAIAVQRAAEVLSAKVAVLRSTTAGDMETVAGDTTIVLAPSSATVMSATPVG